MITTLGFCSFSELLLFEVQLVINSKDEKKNGLIFGAIGFNWFIIVGLFPVVKTVINSPYARTLNY